MSVRVSCDKIVDIFISEKSAIGPILNFIYIAWTNGSLSFQVVNGHLQILLQRWVSISVPSIAGIPPRLTSF